MDHELEEISPSEVKRILKEGKKVSLIDVREDEEVAEGKIPEAAHIKMGEIPERLAEINKSEEHIIICRSGRRSENVAYFLQDQGYKVKNMTGGMLAYNQE
jgi:rhodanese-related sulfurtransferase